jgi:hypothetical protein
MCPLRGYISLLLDFAVYYLRLFRGFVAVVADCWLVNRGICTGGLSENGCDVRPKGGKRALVMGLASRVKTSQHAFQVKHHLIHHFRLTYS